MHIYIVSFALTGITALALGIFVLKRNKRNQVNQSWFALSFAVFIYSIFFCFHISAPSQKLAIIYSKILTVGSIFACPFFLAFVLYLTESFKKYKAIVYGAFFITPILLYLLATEKIYSSSVPHSIFKYYVQPGTAYPIYIIYFVAITIISHVILVKSLMASDSTNKIKIQYLLLASGIAFFAGGSTFATPYGIDYFALLALFMPLYPVIVSYAVVRHQLMDIDVIIKRATIFAGLFILVYGVFSIFTILGQEYFETILGWNKWVAIIPTVFVITLALRPFELFLTSITEKYLFQKKYDYKELLRLFTTEVLTFLELNKVTENTIQALCNIIKLESCGVFLKNSNTGIYTLVAEKNISTEEITMAPSSLIVKSIENTHHILKNEKHQIHDHQMSDELRKINAELCIPITFRREIIGFISLGMKKSGESYNQEDIEILLSLARTEAIAISNAKLFEQLAAMQAEAAQNEKMAVIGTLAAGINHEICNPLGIVRGQCEVFLLNYKEGLFNKFSEKQVIVKAAEVLEKIIKETDRATGITKRLSTFAKPSKMFEMTEVDVSQEVNEVMAILGHEMRVENINVENKISEDFPKINVDKKQLQEVLFNIIRNAAQAMDEAGVITIMGSRNGARATISIEDTGSGIAPDKLDKIFNPFFTTKDPGKGTGLGLFIVKQIVERNEGQIAVRSEVGRGTTFDLTFKIANSLN